MRPRLHVAVHKGHSPQPRHGRAHVQPQRARVTLHEGRYHQIKRMFHRLDGIKLRSLHRDRIGPLSLPVDLPPGRWRPLTGAELDAFAEPPSSGID
jgi:pseudouridine synthase